MPEESQDDEEAVESADATPPAPPQPTIDWEKRYKDTQASYTRETQARRAVENEVLALRAQLANPQPAADPTDPLASERRQLEQTRQQLVAEREWEKARQQHPPEVLTAFDEYQRAWSLNPTPAGAITAYITSLQALGQAAEAAGQTPAEPDAPPPPARSRMDTSRSDGPDPAAIERRIAGAQERKDLTGFVRAKLGLSERRSET